MEKEKQERRVVEGNLVEVARHVLATKAQVTYRLPEEKYAKLFYAYLLSSGCYANYLGKGERSEGYDVEFLGGDVWDISFIGGAYA